MDKKEELKLLSFLFTLNLRLEFLRESQAKGFRPSSAPDCLTKLKLTLERGNPYKDDTRYKLAIKKRE